jgi:hypothetical protein
VLSSSATNRNSGSASGYASSARRATRRMRASRWRLENRTWRHRPTSAQRLATTLTPHGLFHPLTPKPWQHSSNTSRSSLPSASGRSAVLSSPWAALSGAGQRAEGRFGAPGTGLPSQRGQSCSVTGRYMQFRRARERTSPKSAGVRAHPADWFSTACPGPALSLPGRHRRAGRGGIPGAGFVLAQRFEGVMT